MTKKFLKKRSSRTSKTSQNVSFFSKKITNAGDSLIKRMTYSGLVIATGAGTFLPLTTTSSGGVQSTPATEWASFAARYQQYRVRAVRLTAKATQPIQSSTLTHGILYVGDTIGTSAPGSSAQVLSDERVRVVGTDKDFVYTASWARNPNAKLWNPTSAVVPAANTFSIVLISATTPALLTATTYYAYVVEWEVEFRGSQ